MPGLSVDLLINNAGYHGPDERTEVSGSDTGHAARSGTASEPEVRDGLDFTAADLGYPIVNYENPLTGTAIPKWGWGYGDFTVSAWFRGSIWGDVNQPSWPTVPGPCGLAVAQQLCAGVTSSTCSRPPRRTSVSLFLFILQVDPKYCAY